MESKNECPFCGGVRVFMIHDWRHKMSNAYCGDCDAQGSAHERTTATLDTWGGDKEFNEMVIAAFCHPAHMMNGMVLVKRETAVTLRGPMPLTSEYDAAMADLTAALEAKP